MGGPYIKNMALIGKMLEDNVLDEMKISMSVDGARQEIFEYLQINRGGGLEIQVKHKLDETETIEPQLDFLKNYLVPFIYGINGYEEEILDVKNMNCF